MGHAISHGRQNPSKVSLDADVLLIIFSFNTFTDDHFTRKDALLSDFDMNHIITARYTSQVCRLWRSVMLSSPDIWENTIDFRHLQQKGDDWRKEVLRRTGTSLLSIIAHNLKRESPGNNLFFSLLEQESGRIRRIATSTNTYFVGDKYHLAWSALFLKEVPHLEIVHFRNHHRKPYFSLNTTLSQTVLFNNKQTKIHTFILEGFLVFLPGPWNASIHCMELEECRVESSLILSLSGMQALDSLRLVRCNTKASTEQDITLSEIQQFHFNDYAQCAAGILDLIPRKQGSTTDITITENFNQTIPVELESRLRRGLIMHTEGRFSDELSMDLHSFSIELSSTVQLPWYNAKDTRIHISITFTMDIIPSLMLDILAKGSTASITQLYLDFQYFKFGEHHILDAAIRRFLRSLRSVEVLHTTVRNLKALMEQLHRGEIYFRLLHTLVLKPQATPITMDLVDFVKKRLSIGLPLRMIDATGCECVDSDVLEYFKLRPRSYRLQLKWIRPPSQWETRRRRRE